MKERSAVSIVVLERAFVYVGEVERDGDEITIRNAKNIRRWGTTKGLGQLALHGPQPRTALDDAGTVRAPLSAVIHTIDCEAAAWK
ncbi:MAG: hypothetical protein BroJett013_30200 [Alphaproteobacteria bacterium]|nr:MAG: hypothetical protein BroJett013_30200 [Alphaproteobacteria bacterium]